MDRLPETIVDDDLLSVLGEIMAAPIPQSSGGLFAKMFQPDFSWQALVNLAVDHDILPALIFALKSRSLLPPVPKTLSEEAKAAHVTSRLVAAYQQHLDRRTMLSDQLKSALSALNKAGIVPLLLKGSFHLTLTKPAWHEARSMRDLDILVPPSDAERAYRVLMDLGYRPDQDLMPFDRHLPELWLVGGAGTVELHLEALSFSARHALTTKEVWDLAQPLEFAGRKCKALPAEWHMLHGLAHHQLADRGHTRRMLSLKGLWEFASVGAHVSPQGWQSVSEHAVQRGIYDVLSSWCVQAHRLFKLKAPEELLTAKAGHQHAEATFRRARLPYRLRQALFVTDKLRYAFAPETLAFRYGEDKGLSRGALRHAGFLWRHRNQMARRWLGR